MAKKRRPKTRTTKKAQTLGEAKLEVLKATDNPVSADSYGKDWNHLTSAARVQRKQHMLKAIQLGSPKVAIRAMMDVTFGCTTMQCDFIYRDVLKELRDNFTEDLPYAKAAVVQRIKLDIASMRNEGKPPRATILQYERFLAKVEGTEAPIKITMLDVDDAMRDNLAAALAGAPPARMRELIAKGREVKAARHE